MSQLPKYEQSSKALKLSLLDGVLDKSQLHIYLEKLIQINETYSIEMGIIGESHFMSIYHHNMPIFSELFACISLENTQSFELEGNTFQTSYKNSHVTYETNIEVSTYENDVIDSFVLEKQNIMSYNFAAADEEAALTALSVHVEGSDIKLKTLHAYPNEQLIVLSNSKIEMTHYKEYTNA